jgi:hypothetical protein
MKGQASIESLMIIGFAILLFIPLLMLVYIQSSNSSYSVNVMEVNAALSQLSTSASMINSGSENSAIFAKVNIPGTMEYVDARQLCNAGNCITEFVAHLKDGTEMTQVTTGRAEIDTGRTGMDKGRLSPGIYYLKIEAVAGGTAPNQYSIARISIYG